MKNSEQERYILTLNKLDTIANAVRGLSEALAFHQQVRIASQEDRIAVGSDDIEWLRKAAMECIQAVSDAGYPVRSFS